MSKVFIEESTLTSIGDAIRAKGGTTELIAPQDMGTAITNLPSGGGGDIEVEPIVLTGDQSYGCAGAISSAYIDLFGDTITTEDITNAIYMFWQYSGESIPFDINIYGTSTSVACIFQLCWNLKTLPKINFTGDSAQWDDMKNMFSHCQSIREIPEDYFDNWPWNKSSTSTSAYNYIHSSLFQSCYSLRSMPLDWLKNMNPIINSLYTYFYKGFNYCYALDELINLPIPYTAVYSDNLFNNTFSSCHRVKNITFALQEDGSPCVVKWKKQTIDLASYTGYGFTFNITEYNSGITADKEVKDDATYQALKDDPDWFATDINYSRYNHDSAVRTINSLPDASAYLATTTGTNTIKFKGASGALTDGGAINTLTEEEIAVATAKGWSVALV